MNKMVYEVVEKEIEEEMEGNEKIVKVKINEEG